MKNDFIDFHSHHPSLQGERVIQDGIDTQGRHPWHLKDDLPSFSQFPIAVGESGLDRLCDTPYDLQLQVFREEVKRSETLGKPLFLHCVRAIDDVLAIRLELDARQPWIWHGYRGNAQQLLQLLEYAFYFSFGIHYNEQALLACPLDRLLLETDENTTTLIADHYAQVARLKAIPLAELVRQMHKNFLTLFDEEA